MKKVRVLLFAGARDAMGRAETLVQIPLEGTAADVLRHLEDAFPGCAGLLATCRLSVDREFVSLDTRIPEQAEVALIPPVSGG